MFLTIQATSTEKKKKNPSHCRTRDHKNSCIPVFGHASVSHSRIKQTDPLAYKDCRCGFRERGQRLCITAPWLNFHLFLLLAENCASSSTQPRVMAYGSLGLTLPPLGTSGDEISYKKSSLPYSKWSVEMTP